MLFNKKFIFGLIIIAISINTNAMYKMPIQLFDNDLLQSELDDANTQRITR